MKTGGIFVSHKEDYEIKYYPPGIFNQLSPAQTTFYHHSVHELCGFALLQCLPAVLIIPEGLKALRFIRCFLGIGLLRMQKPRLFILKSPTRL
jgi:hypothetical protein